MSEKPKIRYINLNQAERITLRALVVFRSEHGEESAAPFDTTREYAKEFLDPPPTREETRRACRRLAREGLAEYETSLWTEDGKPAGSGYRVTEDGILANLAISNTGISRVRSARVEKKAEGTGATYKLPPPMATGLAGAVMDVIMFHKATGTPVCSTPLFPSEARMALRERLIEEEYTEYKEALADKNIVALADAIVDMIYVLIGTALEYGIPAHIVWAEVQRANMAKINPATGVADKRDDGKIIKPPGWTPPDIFSIIMRAVNHGPVG